VQANAARSVSLLHQHHLLDVEIICFDLTLFDTKLRFFVLYRPLSYDKDASDYEFKLVQCLTDTTAKDILMS